MNKRYLKFAFVCLLVFICTGCTGDITREIRHAGFSMNGKFVCNKVFASKKAPAEKTIKYLTGSHMITDDGEIYEVSFGQFFSNRQNCKEADTKLKVKAIFDNTVIKAEDGKYYFLFSNADVAAYTELTSTNQEYEKFNAILSDNEVVKVSTVDSNAGVYYVLKTDGNIYKYTLGRVNQNTPLSVSRVAVVYDKMDYGSEIVDFNYSGEKSVSTFIRTKTKFTRVVVTNFKECNKYADVACKFEMKDDEVLNKNKDYIIAYNGSTLLTNYGQLFNVSN